MVEAPAVSGFLIYSHMLPGILAFLGILLIANGIMDKKLEYAVGGVILFFAAGILPFLVLPFILGV
ncbi:MAG: hypothetical protein HZC47_10340 [Methanobacterium sp.]|uniref:hypothetical protein n=1 Tax=Methanobacterium sp. TaxID=2164 RepID=UPI003D65E9D3|nr:hypothetical protein [Methanobacterium sp.]